MFDNRYSSERCRKPVPEEVVWHDTAANANEVTDDVNACGLE